MSTQGFSRRSFLVGAAAAVGAGTASSVKASATPVRLDGKPAVLGGTPVRDTPWPEWPIYAKVDEENLMDALRQKKWCRLDGSITTRFEELWAQSLGARYSTAVVNGTNALYAALNALDVGPGDEVVVPPYTFVATVNAVFQQFALPVFADSDPATFQIDAASVPGRITENTRCILPVHLGGNVANMDGLLQVSRERGIPIVEDACQAHFAEWRGKRVGTVGDIGCFSFQASKILPCGEGGAIVTSSQELLDRFHAFQNNGRDRLTGTRDGYLHQGTNLRMTEFQSALLLAQFTRFEEQCRIREAKAGLLTRLLAEIPGIEPAAAYPGCTRNTYYIYMARYDKEHFSGLSRRNFLRAMNREGLPCGAGYRPLQKEPFIEKLLNSRAFRRIYTVDRLRRYREGNECPQNERLSQEGFFLSQRCLLGEDREIEQIAEAIARIQTHAAEIAEQV